mmetsp:Transcript_112626/g.198778  ORF Transcript_112626/g.198778 Transcript_112626/m.198778 type:complete len:84 (+) Transcript_112626:145-396(+)
MRCITVHHHVRMLYKTTLHCELPITAHTSSGSIVALWCYQKEMLLVESLCCITESPPPAMSPVSLWQFCRAHCRSSRRCSAHA